MVIGVLEFDLAIPGNHSLKGKRSVLKSFLARTRNSFNVSVAEVDFQELRNRARVAVTVVGSDRRRVDSILSRVVEFTRAFNGMTVLDHFQHLL